MRLRASPRPETALTCVYSCFGWGYCNPDQSHLAVVIDAADETLFQQVLIHRNHILPRDALHKRELCRRKM